MKVEDYIKESSDLLKKIKNEIEEETNEILRLEKEIFSGDYEHFRDPNLNKHKHYKQ